MIETYGNDMNFHKVVKIEVKKGCVDHVREVIIHQLIETDRGDAEDYDGSAVDSEGRFIMKHEITCFMLRDDPDDPLIVEVS